MRYETKVKRVKEKIVSWMKKGLILLEDIQLVDFAELDSTLSVDENLEHFKDILGYEKEYKPKNYNIEKIEYTYQICKHNKKNKEYHGCVYHDGTIKHKYRCLICEKITFRRKKIKRSKFREKKLVQQKPIKRR